MLTADVMMLYTTPDVFPAWNATSDSAQASVNFLLNCRFEGF